LVFVLMGGLRLANFDYFALLYFVLSMQAVRRLPLALGSLWIGVFTLLMTIALFQRYGAVEGVGFVLIYTAGDVLLGSYAHANRRAQAARARNEDLAGEVQRASRDLTAYASRLEALAATRERNHLGRELHDSVTQTVFSMSLSTQSVLLLLEGEPARAAAQLDHLADLARSALAQMHVLIDELRPPPLVTGGGGGIRRHIANAVFPKGWGSRSRSGDLDLPAAEEEGLFRIAREAVNNVVKHASASHACLRVDPGPPPWMEIADDGCGFAAPTAVGVGLAGIRERAAEIGWSIELESAPGRGTRLRVTRQDPGEITP
jgi:signal transduction histidine kinase